MFTSTKALARSPMQAERSQSLRGVATIPHAIPRSTIAPYSGCVGWNRVSFGTMAAAVAGGGGFEQQKPFSTLKQGEHIAAWLLISLYSNSCSQAELACNSKSVLSRTQGGWGAEQRGGGPKVSSPKSANYRTYSTCRI